MRPFQEIETCRKLLSDPSLNIYLSKDWSSQNENYRSLVRKAVFSKLIELKDTAIEADVLDLSRPPKGQFLNISISHCPGEGGFAISKKNLGWDVEQISRVKDEVVHRIMKSSMSEKPPFAAAMWSAQEASFKAFSPLLKLTHFTEIFVSNWEPISPNIYRFNAKASSKDQSPLNGLGLVFSFSNHVYALMETVD